MGNILFNSSLLRRAAAIVLILLSCGISAYAQPHSTGTGYRVSNTSSSGVGSFAAAIDWINLQSTPTSPFYIDFDLGTPGTNGWEITLSSALPAIIHPTFIDGESQSGFSYGSKMIIIDFGGATNGLIFNSTADNSTVRGLCLHGIGIADMTLGFGSPVPDDYNVYGSLLKVYSDNFSLQSSIFLGDEATFNLNGIPKYVTGYCNGVWVEDADAFNVIQCSFGTGYYTYVPFPEMNGMLNGIVLKNCSDALIGIASNPVNIFSYNSQSSVRVEGSDNVTFNANIIGGSLNLATGFHEYSGVVGVCSDITGTCNPVTKPNNGILAFNSTNIHVGTNVSSGGNTVVNCNVFGIKLDNSSFSIKSNLIGTNGTLAISNHDGIAATNGSSGDIGGTATGEGNIIAANYVGIVLGSVNVRVLQNRIGVLANNTPMLHTFGAMLCQGNFLSGEHIYVGDGTSSGRNIIADGIEFYSTKDIVIKGNYIGNDGTSIIGPGGIAVNVSIAQIGGSLTGDRNIITGSNDLYNNGGYSAGILAGGLATGINNGLTIINNQIGIPGTTHPTAGDGIGIYNVQDGPSVTSNTVLIKDNEICNYPDNGIFMWLVEKGKIEHNYIGISPSNVVSSNLKSGINLKTSDYCTIISNTIKSNSLNGVKLNDASTHNLIESNIIENNVEHGILMNSGSSWNTAKTNQIIHNTKDGINIIGSVGVPTDHNWLTQNVILIDPAGTTYKAIDLNCGGSLPAGNSCKVPPVIYHVTNGKITGHAEPYDEVEIFQNTTSFTNPNQNAQTFKYYTTGNLIGDFEILDPAIQYGQTYVATATATVNSNYFNWDRNTSELGKFEDLCTMIPRSDGDWISMNLPLNGSTVQCPSNISFVIDPAIAPALTGGLTNYNMTLSIAPESVNSVTGLIGPDWSSSVTVSFNPSSFSSSPFVTNFCPLLPTTNLQKAYYWRVTLIYGNLSIHRIISAVRKFVLDPMDVPIPSESYLLSADHTNKINWIYGINYMDDGNVSEGIAYVDGLGKGRQVQTKINSKDVIMCMEAAYSEEGGGAALSMPAPIERHPSYGARFGYSYKFFDVYANGQYHDFSTFDFDAERKGASGTANSLITPSALPSNVAGSVGNFYSAAGPEQYVDDAQGYPFTYNVAYKSPLKRSYLSAAGAGDIFKITGNREYRSFYCKPTQDELDRVFGKNLAPHSQDVSQTITFNPDGVGTISYKDNEGKIIATALTDCNSQLNPLDPLLEEGKQHPLTTHINPLLSDQYDETTLSRNSTSMFFIDCTKNITFNYSVDLSSFTVNGTVCEDCNFDVYVAIINTETLEAEYEKTQQLVPSASVCSSGVNQTVVIETNLVIPLDGPATYKVIRRITSHLDPSSGTTIVDQAIDEYLQSSQNSQSTLFSQFQSTYFTDEKYYVSRKVLSSINSGYTPAQSQFIVSNYSGTGNACETPGPLSVAEYYQPRGITQDDDGNKYIADELNHCVRIINQSGLVSIFAGLPCNPGNVDDVGLDARFFGPYDVSYASQFGRCGSGSTSPFPAFLAVADRGNNLVRKVDMAGVVTTIGGIFNEFSSPEGLCTDRFGNVYVASSNNHKIFKIDQQGVLSLITGTGLSGADNGPVLSASFNHPADVAIDQYGNLYVADRDNNIIRKIDLTGTVSTFAGNVAGTGASVDAFGLLAEFDSPASLEFSPGFQYLYVTDQGSNKIRRIDMTSMYVSTVAGNGTAGYVNGAGNIAEFNMPHGLYVSEDEQIFVADVMNNRIRMIMEDPTPPVGPCGNTACKTLIPYLDEVALADISLGAYTKNLTDLDADVDADGVPGNESYYLTGITSSQIFTNPMSSTIVDDFVDAYYQMHLVHLSTNSTTPPYIQQLEVFTVNSGSQLGSTIKVFDAETGKYVTPVSYESYQLFKVTISWGDCESHCPDVNFTKPCSTQCEEQRQAYYYEMLDAYAACTSSIQSYSAYAGYTTLQSVIDIVGMPLTPAWYNRLSTASNGPDVPTDLELYESYEMSRAAYTNFNVQNCLDLCEDHPSTDPCVICQSNYSSCVYDEMDKLTQGYEYLLNLWDANSGTFPYTIGDLMHPDPSGTGTVDIKDPDILENLGRYLFDYVVFHLQNANMPARSSWDVYGDPLNMCTSCGAPPNSINSCVAAAGPNLSQFPSVLVPLLQDAITDPSNTANCVNQYVQCFQLNDPGLQTAAVCTTAYNDCKAANLTIIDPALRAAADLECDNMLASCQTDPTTNPVRVQMVRNTVSALYPDFSDAAIVEAEVATILTQTATMTLDELQNFLDNYTDHTECVLACENQLQESFNEWYTTFVNTTINQTIESFSINCMGNLNEQMDISFDQTYYNYTLYYYDRANNLISTVPPEGVDYIDVQDPDPAKSNRNPVHRMKTTYQHSNLYTVAIELPDEGKTRYIYDKGGRLRFYQSAEQKARSDQFGFYIFSYTKYDLRGRVIERGEYRDVSGTICCWSQFDRNANVCSCSGTQVTAEYFVDWPSWPSANTVDQNYFTYDSPTANYPGYPQTYLQGRLSRSNNASGSTYYSYDVHGLVTFVMQNINALAAAPGGSYKITEYKYSRTSGKLNELIYQKGRQDEFHHYYEYNSDGQMLNAKVSRVDQANTTNLLQLANYDFYTNGQVKNITLGNQIQNVDYVYNINGWLKAINNPIAGASPYPNDETSGSGISSDVFAEVLNYYRGDYNKTGLGLDVNSKNTPQPGSAAYNASVELFSGNISSIVSRTAFDQTSQTSTPNMMMQAFKYDVLQRLNDVYTETASSSTFSAWSTTAAAADPYGTHITYDANGNILSLIRNTMGRHTGSGISFVNAAGTATNVTSDITEMDNMTYNYAQTTTDFYGDLKKTNNRLAHVNDAALHEVGLDDLEDEGATYNPSNISTHNYEYDANGRIVKDKKNGIISVLWTTFNKIKRISYDAAHQSKTIIFTYNCNNLRLTKEVQYPSTPTNNTVTSYVYESSGILMATYETYYNGSSWQCKIGTIELYARNRVGNMDLQEDLIPSYGTITNDPAKLRFEIADHLGSVRAVVSGVKTTSGGATIIALSDYHDFGMNMRGRSFASTNYRYGYQGSERETQTTGLYATEFRMLDVRIGRWLSVDPIINENISPYTSMNNNPIVLTDVLGLEAGGGNGDPNVLDPDPCSGECTATQPQVPVPPPSVNITINFAFTYDNSAGIKIPTTSLIGQPSGIPGDAIPTPAMPLGGVQIPTTPPDDIINMENTKLAMEYLGGVFAGLLDAAISNQTGIREFYPENMQDSPFKMGVVCGHLAGDIFSAIEGICEIAGGLGGSAAGLVTSEFGGFVITIVSWEAVVHGSAVTVSSVINISNDLNDWENADWGTSKGSQDNMVNESTSGASSGKSLEEQAQEIVDLNGGKNSVTIETPTHKIRFDLKGKAHGNVTTPHKQFYKKNFVNGELKSITREGKEAVPMTQDDMDLIRSYLMQQ